MTDAASAEPTTITTVFGEISGAGQQLIDDFNALPGVGEALYDDRHRGHAAAIRAKSAVFEAAYGVAPVAPPTISSDPIETEFWARLHADRPAPTPEELQQVQEQARQEAGDMAVRAGSMTLEHAGLEPEAATKLSTLAHGMGLRTLDLADIAADVNQHPERTQAEALSALGSDGAMVVEQARKLVRRVSGLGEYLEVSGLGNSATLIKVLARRAQELGL
jgi:hypothetical protein